MAEINEITVKFIVEDEQLIQLGKTANSTFEEFRDGFEFITKTSESTFFKFNKDVETSLKQAESAFDRVFKTNSPFGNILTNAAKLIGGEQAAEIGHNINLLIKDILEPFTNESVIVDLPVDLRPFVNPQAAEPIEGNLQEIAKRQFEKFLAKGRTIEELAQAYREKLQSDLNEELGRIENVEIPELTINIPDLELKDRQRRDLEELIGPTVSTQLQAATDEQVRAFATLRLTLQSLSQQYNKARESILAHSMATKEGTTAQGEFSVSLVDLVKNAGDGALIFGHTKEELAGLLGVTEDVTKKTESLDKEVVNQTENIDEYKGALEQTDTAAQNFGENGLGKVKEGAEEANKALSDIDLGKLLQDFSPEEIAKITGIPIEKIIQQAEMLGVAFEKAGDEAKESLNALGVFAADVAAEINNTFSEFVFRAFKADFDNISDLWESMLDTMLRAFAQFISTVISNPIRIGLETFLSGGGGGGSGLFSSLTGLGGTLGLGSSGLFGASGSFTALTNLFGAGAGGSEGTENTAGDEDGVVIGMFNNKAEVKEVGYRMAA